MKSYHGHGQMATSHIRPRKVPSERAMPMPWLFGLVGLVCCLTLWPCLVLAHLSGLELFRWPTHTVGLMITLNALVSRKK